MSRIKRDPRSSGNAPIILALIVALIMLGLNIFMPRAEASELELYTSHGWQEEFSAMRPGMTYWPDGIVVELNQTNAPVDASMMLERALWSWGQRTGKVITFAGSTASQGASKSGKITVVWKTLAQIRYITGSQSTAAATNRWTYTDTGHIAGAIIYLPIDRLLCLEHAILHEIGHAIGIQGHADTEPTDVMNETQSRCVPALTVRDVEMAPYQDHNCHAELLSDGSLYIPSVGGWAVHLSPSLQILRAVPQSKACVEAKLDGDDLLLSDIRSPSGRWMGQLRNENNQWKVVWVESR